MPSHDANPSNASQSEAFCFREVVLLSALFGAIDGIGEEIFTVGALRDPALASVLFLTGTACFVLGGIAYWLASHLMPRRWRQPLLLFFLEALLAYAMLSVIASLPNRAMRVALSLLVGFLFALPGRSLLRWSGRLATMLLGGVITIAILHGVILLVSLYWPRQDLSRPRRPAESPNVVLVIIDTLRADHLHAYGYARQTSPFMDTLARQGVRFDMAVSTSSWSPPTHASLLTGLYPNMHGVQTLSDILSQRLTTLAEVFRSLGYRTAAFSGDTRYAFIPRLGYAQGYQVFDSLGLSFSDAIGQERIVDSAFVGLQQLGVVASLWNRPSAEELGRAALHWLDRGSGSFFLTVNYFDVHGPYTPPQPWRHAFSRKEKPGGRLLDNSKPNSVPTEELQDEMDAYDGAILYVDHALQQLLAGLARREKLRNTLVVVTADHGELFGEHGLVFHGTLWLPVIRVPLIFYWPGHVPAGVVVARPVSTVDLGRTVLDLIGQSRVAFPGRSLATLWQNEQMADSWPPPVSEWVREGTSRLGLSHHWEDVFSVVSPRYHYIVDPRQGRMLFDWRQDPAEVRNLAADPAYAEVVRWLHSALEQRISTVRSSTRPSS